MEQEINMNDQEKKDKKTIVKHLWEMRHLTMKEALEKISTSPDLKFLLTVSGLWLLIKWVLGLWIGIHIIYFVSRVFNLVLG